VSPEPDVNKMLLWTSILWAWLLMRVWLKLKSYLTN